MTAEDDGDVLDTGEGSWVLLGTRVPLEVRDRLRKISSRMPGDSMKDHVNKALKEYLMRFGRDPGA